MLARLVEGNFRHGPLGGVRQLEELRQTELKMPGDQVGGKRFNQDVEVAHGAVVVAPGQLNLLLELAQVFLKFDKSPIRLQCGIVLGDGEQLAQRRAQQPLGAALIARVAGVEIGSGVR